MVLPRFGAPALVLDEGGPAVRYPFLPPGKKIGQVSAFHPAMLIAWRLAVEKSLDEKMPGAAVIVQVDGLGALKVTGMGVNGSSFHQTNGCERVKRGSRTGEDYDLCKGCSTENHSEARAIADANRRGGGTLGANLYLFGHWFFCEFCWKKMTEAGIRQAFVVEGSERYFNKEHPANVVGFQFKPPSPFVPWW